MSGLHELAVVAAEWITFAVLVKVHKYVLAARSTSRQTLDDRAVVDFALEGSRACLCGRASATGFGHRAGLWSGEALLLAVGMRDACIWHLQVGLGRLGCYILARFGDV